MEKPLVKSQEPSNSSTILSNSNRLNSDLGWKPPLNKCNVSAEYFDRTPGLFTYARDKARADRLAHQQEIINLKKFMKSDESPWQLPRRFRYYYDYFISEYFASLGSAVKVFDRIIVYLLIVYVFFLVVLFIKRLIFKYKPAFMVNEGFVGDLLWYVKDKQIYHKFKLFYLINLFILIAAVFVMAFVFVNVFRIVQTWEAFFYFTHVNYRVPMAKGNQHYLHSAERFFSKRESYTVAGINRKRFVEMLYYTKNDFFTRTRVYTELDRIQLREEGRLTKYLSPRRRITEFDRMIFSNLPSRFWGSFKVLPYNKPYFSSAYTPPR